MFACLRTCVWLRKELQKPPRLRWELDPAPARRCGWESPTRIQRRPTAKKRVGHKNKKPMANTTQSEPLTEAQLSSINGSLDNINGMLSFLVALSVRERKRMAKMGQKTRSFVEDAIEAGIRNPGMLPRSLDPNTMRDKMDQTDQIREIHANVGQLHEKLGDTLTLLGSELYEDARLIYKLTKTKAAAGGLNAAAEGMSRRFARQGRRPADNVTPLAAAA